MNKIKILTICVIFLFLLNAATLCIMFMQHSGPRMGDRQTAASFITNRLQLDASQQQAFEQLRRQHETAIRKVREEDRRLHELYFNLLKSDRPDAARVDSIATLMAAENKVQDNLTFQHFQKLRQLLRPDQVKLFNTVIDEIARKMAPPPPRSPHGRPTRD